MSLFKNIRKKIARHRLRRDIVNFYRINGSQFGQDFNSAAHYVAQHGTAIFPDEKMRAKLKEYASSPASTIHRCQHTGLNYAFLEGKKLFFPRTMSAKRAANAMKWILAEQCEGSPHKYTTEEFRIEPDSVLLDVGSAEGCFALANIDSLSHAYLFETLPEWVEALEQTFAPYSHKVSIINKFVSDKSAGNYMALDDLAVDLTKPLFIKLDVEGEEVNALKGAHNIITSAERLKMAVCTYHLAQAEQEVSHIIESHGLAQHTSEGVMLFLHESDENIRPPYFRRGLVRAFK